MILISFQVEILSQLSKVVSKTCDSLERRIKVVKGVTKHMQKVFILEFGQI